MYLLGCLLGQHTLHLILESLFLDLTNVLCVIKLFNISLSLID